MRSNIVVLIAAGLLTGCSAFLPNKPSATGDTPFAFTFTAIPTLTSAPVVQTPIPPTAVQPFVPFEVRTWADNVLLRSNPGYLFPQIGVLADNTSLLVLGRSQGGEWLLVQASENRTGWVFAQLVETGSGNLAEAPVIQPPATQLVIGTVEDRSSQPVSGIQFSLVQGSGDGAPRNDAMTDETGTFYAFMPAEARGTWWVSYTAVSCKSNTMDSACNCIGACGRPEPDGVFIQLPQPQGTMLEFVWK